MWFCILFICVIYIPYLVWAYNTHKSFKKKEPSSFPAESDSDQKISIVIPFRNEKGTIHKLFNQLHIQSLDFKHHCEVILVNDHSTDGGDKTIQLLLSNDLPNFKLIHAKKVGKKSALTEGINLAKNPWIITLDSDTTLPEKWLKCLIKICASATSDMIILPVEIFPTTSFFQKIEALEFTVLQGITFSYAQKNRPILANGAHLAFKKQAFVDFNGYSSHDHLASGDDVFLMEELKLSPSHSVGYAYSEEYLISTVGSSSLSALLHQKVRWGSKTFQFKSNEVKKIGLLVLCANMALLLWLFSGFWVYFYIAFTVKTVGDLFLVIPPLTKRSFPSLFKYIPLFMIIYPFYITFVSVATLFVTPKWKGRKI